MVFQPAIQFGDPPDPSHDFTEEFSQESTQNPCHDIGAIHAYFQGLNLIKATIAARATTGTRIHNQPGSPESLGFLPAS